MEPNSNLRQGHCVPCEGGIPPLTDEEIAALLPQVPGWRVVDHDGIPELERSFTFPDFKSALAFANAVGALAEEEGHHPEITIGWGLASVAWWTHAIGGLHTNDFIMAAKTNEAYTSQQAHG